MSGRGKGGKGLGEIPSKSAFIFSTLPSDLLWHKSKRWVVQAIQIRGENFDATILIASMCLLTTQQKL